jgi:hypothetical protein
MSLQINLDYETAARVADYFNATGLTTAAANMWKGISIATPYDPRPREKVGELLFEMNEAQYPQGTLMRSLFLLSVIAQSMPTPKLTQAYFENLEQLLKTLPKLPRPGKVVLAVGTGRCGSTTLCAAIAEMPGARSTHENPPIIYWEPLEAQVRFHMDRLRLLADYFALVFDASHWWLNVIGRFFTEFPEGQVIGLHRDTQATVKSYMNIKGNGRGSMNHWALPDNDIWRTNLWDPSYPSYPVNADLLSDPDGAKAEHIERFVTEYNQTLKSLAEADPRRMILVPTEALNDRATTDRLSKFLGMPLKMPSAMNVGGTEDSDKEAFRI